VWRGTVGVRIVVSRFRRVRGFLRSSSGPGSGSDCQPSAKVLDKLRGAWIISSRAMALRAYILVWEVDFLRGQTPGETAISVRVLSRNRPVKGGSPRP